MIQLREYQILIANDWNLAVKNAYDFIHVQLQEKGGPIWDQLRAFVRRNIRSYLMASGEQIPFLLASVKELDPVLY